MRPLSKERLLRRQRSVRNETNDDHSSALDRRRRRGSSGAGRPNKPLRCCRHACVLSSPLAPRPAALTLSSVPRAGPISIYEEGQILWTFLGLFIDKSGFKGIGPAPVYLLRPPFSTSSATSTCVGSPRSPLCFCAELREQRGLDSFLAASP